MGEGRALVLAGRFRWVFRKRIPRMRSYVESRIRALVCRVVECQVWMGPQESSVTPSVINYKILLYR